jgi:hypothetical protein
MITSFFRAKIEFGIGVFLLIPLIFLGILVTGISFSSNGKIANSNEKSAIFYVRIAQIKKLQGLREKLEPKYLRVDPLLPGISTAQADFFLSQYRLAVREERYREGEKFLNLAGEQIDSVLENQQEVAAWEVERLNTEIESNLKEARDIFTPVADIETGVGGVAEANLDSCEQFSQLKNFLMEIADRISKRRLQMEEAVKSIVVSRSRQEVLIYEDGQLVQGIPISLGRMGRETRIGEFRILDKMDKVWGYYQIWMPYWMGIYFAGSSENGFHGIPWDKAGNRYWEGDIGENNVTYGCIMAQDDDMRRLYNWAKIGTPVTVVN